MKKLVFIITYLFIFSLSFLAIGKLTRKNELAEGQIIQIGIHNIAKDNFLLADEQFHSDQILRLAKPVRSLNAQVTTLPGYHFIAAQVIKFFNNRSPFAVRLTGLFLNLLIIPAFFLTGGVLFGQKNPLVSLELSFFPLIFPFYPLLYTDLFSLSLVLFSFYFVLKKRYYLAGIAAAASLLIRQNNIVWFIFFLGLIYIQEKLKACLKSRSLPSLRSRLNREKQSRWASAYPTGSPRSFLARDDMFPELFNQVLKRLNFSNLLIFMEKSLFFSLAIIGFSLFVILNKGVSMAQQNLHPVSFTHSGNLYFFLFSFFLIYLPVNIANFPKIISLLSKKPWIIPAIIGGFFVFNLTFVNNHPYNQIHRFIRNEILMFFASEFFLKVVFYLFIVYALLSFLVTELIKKQYYLLYPLIIVSLLAFWLIEPRYYLPSFVFFNLTRKPQSKKVESSLLLFFIVCSLILFKGTIEGKFFI